MLKKLLSLGTNILFKTIAASILLAVMAYFVVLGRLGNFIKGYIYLLELFGLHRFTHYVFIVIDLVLIVAMAYLLVYNVYSKKQGFIMGIVNTVFQTALLLYIIFLTGITLYILSHNVGLEQYYLYFGSIFTAIISFTVFYITPKVSVKTIVVNGLRNTIRQTKYPLTLEFNEKLLIKVYGCSDSIVIESEPEGAFYIKYLGYNLLSHDYIAYPLREGRYSILLVDKENNIVLTNIDVVVKDMVKENIIIMMYLNENLINEYNALIEVTKPIKYAVKPFIDITINKLGLTKESIADVKILDINNNEIPAYTPIEQLTLPENKVKVIIVVTDEFRELIKRMNIEEIENLWDKLMKRLEIVSLKIERAISIFNNFLK